VAPANCRNNPRGGGCEGDLRPPPIDKQGLAGCYAISDFDAKSGADFGEIGTQQRDRSDFCPVPDHLPGSTGNNNVKAAPDRNVHAAPLRSSRPPCCLDGLWFPADGQDEFTTRRVKLD
jgi:hypothetical protein